MKMRITLGENGQLTVPEEIRLLLELQSGDELEVAVTEGHSVMLRPIKTIPRSQAWFWTADWQQGEREAAEDIFDGKTRDFADAESFLASLT